MGRGARTTQDAVAFLRRRGVSPEAAAALISECRARGLADDGALARLLADHWARKGYAWPAIRERLAARGLEARAIDEAGDRLRLPAGDAARAREAASAFLARTRIARREPALAHARLARLLAARGFEEELIGRVVEEALGPSRYPSAGHSRADDE